MLKKNMFTPLPSNISYWWNFGSLLGACLVIQILSGLFLSMFYENNMTNSFDSINNIMRNINLGWMIRLIHANGASLFFIMIYMHIGRGLFFKSFSMKPVWLSGSLMLFTLMATAFIGYVLPWGQMSFWGATVITNLLSSIPYIGKMMTIWIWGNFSINKSTLMRFFSLHFILPFLMVAMATIHMIFLHKMSSSNPLGVNKNLDKIPFQPFFSFKDYTSLLISMIMFMLLTLMLPYLLMDPDNFMPANPMVTPVHIQPEWYFLFAYAILRSIPNKLGGVIALFMSIFIIMATTFIPLKKNLKLKFNLMYKILFFLWMFNTMYLTLMGMMPIEEPFENISKILSMNYFLFFAIYL